MKENKWTECGFNANWSVQAWHYVTNTPNCVDGDDPYKEVVFIDSFKSKEEAMRHLEETQANTYRLYKSYPHLESLR